MIEELMNRAEQGDANAQYDLGECYWNGTDGVTQDFRMAAYYYELAADQGHIEAIYSLGFCYANAKGVEQDPEWAEKLLIYAADHGSIPAARKLGEIYYWGDPLPEDKAKGYRYLQYAADNGDEHAMAIVGHIYLIGLGGIDGWGPPEDRELGRKYVEAACDKEDPYGLFMAGSNYCGGYEGFPVDKEKGVRYLKRAAELGHNYAQLEMAIKCWNGDGVPQSQSEHVRWLKASAENGNEEAIIRWAFEKYFGSLDGVRCRTEGEFNECRGIIEKALAEGNDFMNHSKDIMDELHQEEARLGRKFTMRDMYGQTAASQSGTSEKKIVLIIAAALLCVLMGIGFVSCVGDAFSGSNDDYDRTYSADGDDYDDDDDTSDSTEYYDLYDEPYTLGNPTYATASSQLEEQFGNTYDPENAIDGDETTAWVEGADDDGVGEWIDVTFDNDEPIEAISISNGYQKSEELFQKNNRIRQAEVQFEDGTAESFELYDHGYGDQIVYLSEPKNSNSFTLTIQSVYPGSEYGDTCISEIGIARSDWAYPSSTSMIYAEPVY